VLAPTYYEQQQQRNNGQALFEKARMPPSRRVPVNEKKLGPNGDVCLPDASIPHSNKLLRGGWISTTPKWPASFSGASCHPLPTSIKIELSTLLA
jgi:hypothetical protein